MNSAHPFENPTGLTNFLNSLAMMMFPFALVLMYGRMLARCGMLRRFFGDDVVDGRHHCLVSLL